MMSSIRARVKTAYLHDKNIDSVFEQMVVELYTTHGIVSRKMYIDNILRDHLKNMMTYVFFDLNGKFKINESNAKKTVILLNAVAMRQVITDVSKEYNFLNRNKDQNQKAIFEFPDINNFGNSTESFETPIEQLYVKKKKKHVSIKALQKESEENEYWIEKNRRKIERDKEKEKEYLSQIDNEGLEDKELERNESNKRIYEETCINVCQMNHSIKNVVEMFLQSIDITIKDVLRENNEEHPILNLYIKNIGRDNEPVVKLVNNDCKKFQQFSDYSIFVNGDTESSFTLPILKCQITNEEGKDLTNDVSINSVKIVVRSIVADKQETVVDTVESFIGEHDVDGPETVVDNGFVEPDTTVDTDQNFLVDSETVNEAGQKEKHLLENINSNKKLIPSIDERFSNFSNDSSDSKPTNRMKLAPLTFQN